MRDYDELVHDIRCCFGSCTCNTCSREKDSDMERCYSIEIDAADAIEELLAAVPKWISVEERLPEDSGYTIVFCSDGDRRHVTFAKYLKTPKRWELSGARSYWRVLKWMPLPDPPKEAE